MAKLSRSPISPELKTLVHQITDLWGETILEEGGQPLFHKIESLRKFLTRFRKPLSDFQKTLWLKTLISKMKQLRDEELMPVVHSFSILLELINICENVIRSQKIQANAIGESSNKKQLKQFEQKIFLVLTAHPTESRAPEIVEVLAEVQKILLQKTLQNDPRFADDVKPLLKQIWAFRLARKKKPEVRDEAEYIYSLLLKDEALQVLLSMQNRQLAVHTWVGGDKDGHTGVNAKVMLQSLEASRLRLATIFLNLLEDLKIELTRFEKLGQEPESSKAQAAISAIDSLKKKTLSVRTLKDRDAAKIEELKRSYQKLTKKLGLRLSSRLLQFKKIDVLWKLFPYLVVPLELRESSDVLRDFAKKKNKAVIFKMLVGLRKLQAGSHSTTGLKLNHEVSNCGYAKSLIISMTESIDDLKLAEEFVLKGLGKRNKIPVVPLFEQNKDLAAGPEIMEKWLQFKKIKSQEIMLGYSDSSKQAGVWPSRLAIHEAMKNFENLKRKIPGLELTYFHGSGGSVDRGGGSLEDQTSFWPPSAFERYKVTIQGEMIQRTFATTEIFEHNLQKIESLSRIKHHGFHSVAPELKKLSENVSKFYKESLSAPSFLKMIQLASAYRFLEKLNFGSRPTKRKKLSGVNSLRAIPWILSWTQTRVLLPIWWGLGTGFHQLSKQEQLKLQKLARGQDLQFTSYIHQLGFTLAKIEMPIWNMYLDNSELSLEEKKYFKTLFKNEHDLSVAAFKKLSGSKSFLPDKLWLEQSIHLRSPLIHPLNVAQIIAAEKKNWVLLRECSVGIACGMVTTG